MSYTNVIFKQNITKNVNRDQIQRQRLDDRVGYNSKFQTAGNLIFKPQQKSTLHVSEKQRFNKDHVVNDKIVRQSKRDRDDRFYDARLNKRMERDQQRWDKQGEKDVKQETKRVYHQKVLLQNKRNTNGLGYNPINQAYEPSERGEKLKNFDQTKEVHRFARSKNVIERNNTGFNIITGEPKQVFTQVIPEKYQERVNRKYYEKKQSQAIKYEPVRDKYDYLDD